VPGCSGEFADDPEGYPDARARKNYAGTIPDHPRLGHKEGHDRFAQADLDEWLSAGRVEPITDATVSHDLRGVV